MGRDSHTAGRPSSPASARFELLDLIGAGGMAEVFRARLRGIDGFERVVALKMLRSDLGDYPRQRERLAHEARILSRLDHPNIVQALDFLDVGGRPTIVLEHVRGPDLRVMLERVAQTRTRLPEPVVVGVARDILLGLGHAAQTFPGLVHGDVSPGNIMLSRNGQVKLVDFGLASTSPEPALRGKPAYLAPEILRGAVPDARSDLFALGVVLWEALTLRRLFKHEDDAQTVRNIVEVPIDERLARSDLVPAGLAPILRRALARDPHERFASARELAKALGEWLAEIGARAVTSDTIGALVDRLFPIDEVVPVSRSTGPVFEVKDAGEPPPLPTAALDMSVLEDVIAVLEEKPESETFADIALGSWLDPTLRFYEETTPDGESLELGEGAVASAGFTPLGRLEPLTFPAVVLSLALRRQTGALTVVDGARRKTVYLVDGMLGHVASNDDHELLGRRLTRSGAISSAAAASALELARATGLRFGRALLDLQATSSENIATALDRQARERFHDVLGWSSGRATFDRGRLAPTSERSPSGPIDPVGLVTASLREGWPEARLARLFEPLSAAVVRWKEPPRQTLARLELAPAEKTAFDELRRARHATVGDAGRRAPRFALFLAIVAGFARLERA
ncbi:MAG: serine/threonine-protein kinase [Myxococcota bacterium]